MSLLSKRTFLVGASSLALVACNQAQQAVEQIASGAAAPDFSVLDANGVTRTLAEFRGQTVVLEWTNHGCPYVRKHYDAGNMQTLQQEATANGVVWLQVISSSPGTQGYLDGPGALARVQTENAHPTATLLDPEGVMGRAYGATNTPHMYIINAEGQLVYQGAIDDRPSARADTLEGANNYVRAALADISAGRAVATPQTQAYGCSVKYA
jgi:peroxiredoxin